MTVDRDGATGQLHFDSHLAAAVEVAAALVNALATDEAYGRRIGGAVGPAEEPARLRARAQEALHSAGARRGKVRTEDVPALHQLAGDLRSVFTALDDDHEDQAAEILNHLLTQSGARPHLHRHPPAPWHLHFHDPGAGLVQGWTAGCATGLAAVLGSEHARRLGTCAAPACQRVYLDTSRNGSRRYCSTSCQNRVKAATHRARTPHDRGVPQDRAATGSRGAGAID